MEQTSLPINIYLSIYLSIFIPTYLLIYLSLFISRVSFRGVMDKVLNCGLEVNEFQLQSRYYFRTNILGKGMISPLFPINRFNSITAVLLQGWLWD